MEISRNDNMLANKDPLCSGSKIMANSVKVVQFVESSPSSGKVVEANGQSIELFNIDGPLYAIDNTCTMSADRSAGEI